MIDILTYSRIQARRTCPKLHYIAYELGIRKKVSDAPLRIGSAIHDAIDVYAQTKCDQQACDAIRNNYYITPEWADEFDWRIEESKCLRLFMGYIWRWSEDQYEVIATEQAFEIPIRNPKTGRAIANARFAGKIDKIVRLPDGRIAIMEHKTTGDPIDADSEYWPRLRIDTQISGYFHAARDLGHDVETVIYDVIHKPDISPCLIPLRDGEGFKIVRDASGKRLFKADSKPYQSVPKDVDAKIVSRRETPQEYGDRLTNDIANRPDVYFARKEIPRLESDIDEFLNELVASIYEIRMSRRNGWHQRNTQACKNPYPCTYRDACWNGFDYVNDTPQGFVRVAEIHPELKGKDNAISTTAESTTTETIDSTACA